MSLLSQVQTGKNPRPPKLLIAGIAGVGKSTFASGAENVLFIEAENRTDHLDVARFKANKWTDILKILKEIPDSEYKTVVFDTLDAMELLIFDYICEMHGLNDVNDFGGGYFQFRSPLLTEWKKFIKAIDELTIQGIQCVLIAHTHIKTFTAPGQPAYDRWALKMDARSSDFIIENVDLVGFAHFKTFVKEGKGAAKAKATTTNKRVLEFKYNPTYPTKQGVPVGDSCSLTWSEYQEILQ